jgi:hypothetical protein
MNSPIASLKSRSVASGPMLLALVVVGAAIGGPARAAPVLNPANGHYYQAVVFDDERDFLTWDAARAASAAATFRGVHGHLATISSKAENDFLIARFGPVRSPRGELWVGGTDDPVNGEWRWVVGPEAGTLFWLGGPGGQEILFADWLAAEPNDAFGPGTESRLGWTELGWNDLPASGFGSLKPGYIIEYSTVPDDGTPVGIPPKILYLRSDPESLPVGKDGYVLARAEAYWPAQEALVRGVELSVNGGAWIPMAASDGVFNSSWKSTIASVGPFFRPGAVSICARAFDFGGLVSEPLCSTLLVTGEAQSDDRLAPVISELGLYRTRALFGQDNQVTAFADDGPTGASLIQSFQYRLNDGPWQPMESVDGAFDETFEAATAVFGPLISAGANVVCVRAVDAAGNATDPPACLPFEVAPP